jgi:hypothetical protein
VVAPGALLHVHVKRLARFRQPTPPDNVVIENNWFDDTGGNSIMFRSDTCQVLTDYTLRYNSFLSAFFAEGPGTWKNFNVVGNISPMNPWGALPASTTRTTCWATRPAAPPTSRRRPAS